MKKVEQFLENHPYLSTIAICASISLATFECYEWIFEKSNFIEPKAVTEKLKTVLVAIALLIIPLALAFTYLKIQKEKKEIKKLDFKEHFKNVINYLLYGPSTRIFVIIFIVTYTVVSCIIAKSIITGTQAQPPMLVGDSLKTTTIVDSDKESIAIKPPVDQVKPPPAPTTIAKPTAQKKYPASSGALAFGTAFFDDYTNASIVIESVNSRGNATGTINLPDRATPVYDDGIDANKRWNFTYKGRSYTMVVTKIDPYKSEYEVRVSEK